jgi:predicted metal-dependent phosphoesterase TrpH
MTLRYDLHSHSTASDGTLTPTALIAAAHQAGVDVLALTDHDTTDGLDEARQQADALGLCLVPGVEISVSWGKQTIHVLGLHINPACEGLQKGLESLCVFRDWRAEEIGRRLDRAGITGSYAGASQWAKGRVVNRTHFARFLVKAGYARNVSEVFKRYLVCNKPGYVAGEWATLEAVLGWIKNAGGIAVLAHPVRYRMTATKLRTLLCEFRELGGQGMEVVSGSHTPDHIRTMARTSCREQLLASCGSDFHGPENPWIRLGKLATLPAECEPIWSSQDWPN